VREHNPSSSEKSEGQRDYLLNSYSVDKSSRLNFGHWQEPVSVDVLEVI